MNASLIILCMCVCLYWAFLLSVICRLSVIFSCLGAVHEHSCACVYTRGLGTPTASQHNIFDSEKLNKEDVPHQDSLFVYDCLTLVES